MKVNRKSIVGFGAVLVAELIACKRNAESSGHKKLAAIPQNADLEPNERP